jgi:hypothetical protein
MIKKVEETTEKLTVKGVIEAITADGIEVYDEKEDVKETVRLDDLQFLVGKNANLVFSVKE